MVLKSGVARRPSKTIRDLVATARNHSKNEARGEVRYPLFRPVSIELNNRRYSAFTREITNTGIGLLHNFEVPLGELDISFSKDLEHFSVPIRIVWCRSCGQGWYVSGGEFLLEGETDGRNSMARPTEQFSN
jgi:hypothetical protein